MNLLDLSFLINMLMLMFSLLFTVILSLIIIIILQEKAYRAGQYYYNKICMTVFILNKNCHTNFVIIVLARQLPILSVIMLRWKKYHCTLFFAHRQSNLLCQCVLYLRLEGVFLIKNKIIRVLVFSCLMLVH